MGAARRGRPALPCAPQPISETAAAADVAASGAECGISLDAALNTVSVAGMIIGFAFVAVGAEAELILAEMATVSG